MKFVEQFDVVLILLLNGNMLFISIYSPDLCSMLFITLCEFCLTEFSHDSSVAVGFLADQLSHKEGNILGKKARTPTTTRRNKIKMAHKPRKLNAVP